MNILHICSYYNSSGIYAEMNSAYQRAGIPCTFYVPLRASQKRNRPEANVKESVCFTGMDRFFFHHKHRKILKDFYRQIGGVAGYSLLHAHSLFSNGYIAYRLKQAHNIPYITAVRDTDMNTFFKKMPHLRSLGVKILRDACAVVFLSEAYRDELLARYVPASDREAIRKKSHVIPNGINAFWLEHKAYDRPLPEKDKIRIVFAGSIDRRKNPLATAEACRLLMQQGYTVTFTAVGRVGSQGIYNALLKKPFVRTVSHMSKEELCSLYREQDLFVMPSITETFGLVYAEAMTQGLPVIYTKGQGFDRQFEEGTVGYHVDCRNPREIADRVLDCMKNYAALSKNCCTFSERFNWDTIAQEYKNLYEALDS